jgi:hypothetical protein
MGYAMQGNANDNGVFLRNGSFATDQGQGDFNQNSIFTAALSIMIF